jgi:hypothetical protein
VSHRGPERVNRKLAKVWQEFIRVVIVGGSDSAMEGDIQYAFICCLAGGLDVLERSHAFLMELVHLQVDRSVVIAARFESLSARDTCSERRFSFSKEISELRPEST